jgi:hypothetical protein
MSLPADQASRHTDSKCNDRRPDYDIEDLPGVGGSQLVPGLTIATRVAGMG